MRMKRFLAVLLTALLLLPLCVAVVPETGANAEAADDIWAMITDYEDQRFSEQGIECETAAVSDYISLRSGIQMLVESWNGYEQGSFQSNGDFLIWADKDGMGYGYSPRMRQIQRGENRTGASLDEVSGVETYSYAARGGSPASVNVALFGPFYGQDSSFTDQYKNEARSIAQTLGGNCNIYSSSSATIDNIADMLETCGVVIFDSHGDTDYSGYGGDYTSRANTSYLCLTSGTGITQADKASAEGEFGTYYHVLSGGGIYYVDGTAIANHMEHTAPNSFLWMAICLGMATDGMEAAMRAQGVEVVYGYSQSVTFAGDYKWEAEFWTKMKNGSDVSEAIAYMKDKIGYKDPYTSSYPAYPIVVSSEDVYPGHGNVDKKQTVNSTWTLESQFEVTAVSNDTNLGTVSVSGRTITASPKEGCYAAGATVLSGSATVTQMGNRFNVAAQSDCTVQINFAHKTPATVTFVTPEGVSASTIHSYIGDPVVLPTPTGTPTANSHAYKFYGWTEAQVQDTEKRPDFFRAGETITLSDNTVLYALYSYPSGGTGLSEDCYAMITAEPEDWSGEYVLTYDASRLLDASGDVVSRIYTSDAVVRISSTDIIRNGDRLENVDNDYIYIVEAVKDGYYTVRMKGSDTDRYLCYNSGYDRLAVTSAIIGTAAYWYLKWENNQVVFQSVNTPSATLRFYPNSDAFNCKKNNGSNGEALTVFSNNGAIMVYTTELTSGQVTPPGPGPEPVVTYGDANGDGKVTSADAAAVLRHIVGLAVLTAAQARSADVDGDGEVTAADAALILQFVVGLVESLPMQG